MNKTYLKIEKKGKLINAISPVASLRPFRNYMCTFEKRKLTRLKKKQTGGNNSSSIGNLSRGDRFADLLSNYEFKWFFPPDWKKKEKEKAFEERQTEQEIN